jgi:hypothetical protein
MQAFTVNCAGPAGWPPSGECTGKKIPFLHVRHGNLYENKGSLWKSGSEAGMFMKIKVVIRSKPEYI